MDPKPLDDFLPYVNAEVDGAPVIIVREALLQTCMEFCSQTLLVRDTLGGITLSPNVAEYELEPTLCDSEVARVLSVRVNGALLPASTIEVGRRMAAMSQSNTPATYFCAEPGLLTLAPTPTASGLTMSVEVAIMPAFNATKVPDLLFKRHRANIVRGTAARLMLMPNRPWSNPEHGQMYRRLFWQEMHSVARADHWDGYGRPVQLPGGTFL